MESLTFRDPFRVCGARLLLPEFQLFLQSLSSGDHIHRLLGSQPGSLILVFLLGNLTTIEQCPINLPSTGPASLRRIVPPQVWWRSMQMPEETPCARAGLEEVDTKSPASTAGPDFRVDIYCWAHLRREAMKMRLCVAENLSLLSEFGLGR